MIVMPIINDDSKLRKNYRVTPEELSSAKSFIQGAVYSWLKSRPNEGFAVRDLVGGVNFDWKGTPLYCFFEKHHKKGKSGSDAITDAGKDVGWLLKSVLHEDKREFEKYDKGLTNGYRWKK